MASEETPVIQGFLTEVFQTVNPKKEFRQTLSKVSGINTPDIDATISKVDIAQARAPSMGFSDFLTASPNASQSDSVWATAQTNASQQMNSLVLNSGRSPKEWADQFGLTEAEFNAHATDNMATFKSFVDSKYPGSTNAPGTTSTTTTTTTSTTTTTTSGSPTADKLMGETKAGPGDGATVEERAALAEKAAAEIKAKAATEEGMSAWQKLAKRMKNNPKKTILLGKGAAALVVVATIVGIALNRYLASDGAEIEFTSIKTHPEGLLDYLVNPTDVDCQWKGRKTGPKALPTVPLSDIRVLEGDGVTFHDAQLPKVEAHTDGVAPTGVADEKKEFSVSTETGDSSDIDYKNKGWGVVHTSFGAHFAATVNELVDDFASALNKARKQFFPDFTSLLNGLLVVIAFVIGVMAIGAIVSGVYSLSKSGSTSNTG